MKVNLIRTGERLDDLELDDLKIIQRKSGYKFSTDSVLLANFGKAKQNDIYIDMCSGSGVVAMLFLWKNKIKKGYCLEIQEGLAEMSARSIEYNNLSDRLEVVNADLKNAVKIFGSESVDVITVNPPYNPVGETSTTDEIAIATHELKVNLKDIVVSASKILKFGGKFYMVHRADRLVDIMSLLREYKLEPKVLRIVYPKLTKEPNLVLVEAKKGAKPGIKILNPLILNNEDGTETDELKKIYNRKN
ncbi:MAG: tRNA1(Val) (adenine(37)-N6)-methyltransferase [Clostridia bacterium]|nr:tRNA1(Val) (adenine(37)-N6)-methyltransferase [Clostridia bacterium]